jgi:hypothetical protein
MRLVRSNPVIRSLVVLCMTVFALILGAILLPPNGSNAMPRDGGGDTLVTAPR